MEILVTEVTDMSANMMCVAAWDIAGERMVRPLPDGHHWSSQLIAQIGIGPGSIIDVTASGKAHGGEYPHTTEDLEVLSGSIASLRNGVNWFGAGAPRTDKTLASGFNNAVTFSKVWNGRLQGVYVPRGTVCPSLIGLDINSGSIQLFEAFGKLKARVNDGDETYELSVSSHELHVAHANGGLKAASKLLPKFKRVHVRIGLARAWVDHPDQCYVMLNGVNW